MLISSQLRDKIISSLKGYQKGRLDLSYLTEIKSYVESNIMINATYMGVTSVGVPDPLNGPIQLNLMLNPAMPQGLILQPLLKSLKSANPNSFINAIMSESNPSTITGPVTHTLTSPGIYSVKSLSASELDSMKKLSDYKSIWLMITDKLVESYLTLTATLTPIPTVTASGTGTTVITTVL